MEARSKFEAELKRSRRSHLVFGALFLMSLVVVVFQAYLGGGQSRETAIRDAVAERQVAARMAALVLSGRFDRMIDTATALATRPAFRELVADREWEKAGGSLATLPAELLDIERVALYDTAGIAKFMYPELPERVGRDFSQHPLYAQIAKDWRPHVSSVFRSAQEPYFNIVAIVVPIVSETDGKPMGILLSQARVDRLVAWTHEVFEGSATAYFIDSGSHPIGHPDHPIDGELADFSSRAGARELMDARSGAMIVAGEAGERSQDPGTIVAYAAVPGHDGWGAVIEQPVVGALEAHLEQMEEDAEVRATLVGFLLTLIAAMVAMYFYWNRRLRRVVRGQMADIESGEVRMRHLVDNLPLGLGRSDGEGRIVYANPKMIAMFGGATEDATIGTRVEAVYADPKDRQVFVRAMAKGGTQHFEFRFRRLDGEVFWGALTSIQDKESGGYISLIEDISKRREAEQRVLETDKLKTNFITALAHVSRTPLTSIGWNAESLIAGDFGRLKEEQKVLLQRVLESKDKLTTVIGNISMALDVEMGVMKVTRVPHALSEVVRPVAEAMRPNFERRGIAFEVTLPGRGLKKVNVDPEKIRVLVEALLNNALEYTDKGGTVKIGIEKGDDGLLVRVVDTGIGIPKDEQLYTYDLFWRASNAARKYPDGVGIGLYLADAIVKAHGGKFGMESEEGNGSMFWFTIPYPDASR